MKDTVINGRDAWIIDYDTLNKLPKNIYYDTIPKDSTWSNLIRRVLSEPKIDTIACYLLISDKEDFDYTISAAVVTLIGYEVRQGYSIIGYLDSRKNKLKNIIVWQATEIK